MRIQEFDLDEGTCKVVGAHDIVLHASLPEIGNTVLQWCQAHDAFVFVKLQRSIEERNDDIVEFVAMPSRVVPARREAPLRDARTAIFDHNPGLRGSRFSMCVHLDPVVLPTDT